jgi:hypothetical protein
MTRTAAATEKRSRIARIDDLIRQIKEVADEATTYGTMSALAYASEQLRAAYEEADAAHARAR